ncbi:MAG: flagellar export protein FliJ [Ignavibacteriaceae bacterium]|jgi:flagellar FliJ protein|nr:flagellar export protein FliJ [Ignavibacteriaceae bacterium]
MGKFKFQFDSIVRVKEIFEKNIMKDISVLEKEIYAANKKIDDLKRNIKSLENEIGAGKISALNYKSSKNYIHQLEVQMESFVKLIIELKAKREKKFEELRERKKEIQILETLKENKKQEYIVDSNREELKQLNEIAISNFVRKEN